MTFPIIGVVQHEAVPGIYSMRDSVKIAMEVLPLDEALRRQWPTAALFTGYTVGNEKHWPRLNKRGTVIAELERSGSPVRTVLFAFDYDRPKVGGSKVPWASRAEINEVLGRLRAAPVPTAFYVTRHGLRLIYVLTEPIDPFDGERFYAGMLQVFRDRCGVEFDPACGNLDRLFRLPFFTTEDGSQSWDNDLIANSLVILPDQRLDLSTITPVDVAQAEQSVVSIQREQRPDEEEAAELIEYVDEKGKLQLTRFGKMAKNLIRGRDYFDAVFNGEPLPCPDGRDVAITRTVGSLVTVLQDNAPDATAKHVFALLMRPVARFAPDEQEPSKSWLSVLWEKIERLWAVEYGKRVLKSQEVLSFSDRIIDGYRMMMRSQGIDIDQESKRAGYEMIGDYVLRNSIATDGTWHYILLPTGTFSDQPSKSTTLIADIHAAGMQTWYPLVETGPTGTQKAKKPQSLIDEFGISYQRIEGVIGARSGKLRHLSSVERVLEVPLYRLSDDLLESAEPNSVVANWIELAFGDQAGRVSEWISHAFDLHHGICALSIVGPPNTGKTLFAEIMARCFHVPIKNDGRVFGRFNASLAQSPIVHIDEGLESMSQNSGRSVDETFRAMTTGGQITLEQKNMPTYTARLYPRMILTANSGGILEAIVGKRDLSADSRAALEERVLMVRADSRAQQLFRAHGSRWVTEHFLGDQMAAPRHFLWLYLNRRPPQGKRLLVEGDSGTDLFREMSLSTNTAQIIVRALVEMVNLGEVRGMMIEDWRVLVTASAIEKYIEANIPGFFIPARQIGHVLHETDLATVHRWKDDGKSRARMSQINLGALIFAAGRSGMDVTRLVAMESRRVKAAEAMAGIPGASDISA